MSSVVRLTSGGSIQVRTGVIQGIGPTGPEGPAGPIGADGPVGPQGVQGVPGQFTNFLTKCTATGQSLAINTDTNVVWNTTTLDELGARVGTTSIKLAAIGDYMFNVWIQFAVCGTPPTTGQRHLWVESSTAGVTVARVALDAHATSNTHVSLTTVYRSTVVDESMRIKVRNEDGHAVSITGGNYTLTRVGAGLTGPQGPQGVAGVPGTTPWRGTWNAGTAYVTGDLVHYPTTGAAYIRKTTGTSATAPSADTTNWDVFALRGLTGSAGGPFSTYADLDNV
jgi:hypothetical protein